MNYPRFKIYKHINEYNVHFYISRNKFKPIASFKRNVEFESFFLDFLWGLVEEVEAAHIMQSLKSKKSITFKATRGPIYYRIPNA